MTTAPPRARLCLHVPADGVCEWLCARAQLPRTWRRELQKAKDALLALADAEGVHVPPGAAGDDSVSYLHMQRVPLGAFAHTHARAGVAGRLLEGMGVLDRPVDTWQRGMRALVLARLHIADVGVYMERCVKYLIPGRRAEAALAQRTALALRKNAEEVASTLARDGAALEQQLQQIGATDANDCGEQLRAYVQQRARVALLDVIHAVAAPATQLAAQQAIDIIAYLASLRQGNADDAAAATEGAAHRMGACLAVFRHACNIEAACAWADGGAPSGEPLADLTNPENRQRLLCDALAVRSFFAQRWAETTFPTSNTIHARAGILVDMFAGAPAAVYHAATTAPLLLRNAEAVDAVVAKLTSPELVDALDGATSPAAVEARASALAQRAARLEKLREREAVLRERATAAFAQHSAAAAELESAREELASAVVFVHSSIQALFPACDIEIAGVPDA